jgi:pimeloyl-ACP methyl ester carboxylesterase
VVRAVSRDGTEIAYWTSGEGPPLLLVHGAPADHTRWGPLLPYLEPHATVHAMDRRGRGQSGDAPDYRLAREFEDVAAVVEAVAAGSGSTVDVYGHSFGGLCAFGAATVTSGIRRLVLYEGWPVVNADAVAVPPGVAERVDALVAHGNRDAAVETVFREVAMLSDEEVSGLRADPAWEARVAVVHTITRELRVLSEAAFDSERAAQITVPTLLVTGAGSADPSAADVETVAAALPNARIAVLEGQQHVADVLAPEVFARHLVAFLRGEDLPSSS